ncbi:MAG TPA: ribosome-associated translation inhibitor RaiA [Burkholderiales bacterium]|nr:ribosome-associated translation inhibitor RaiA [Burkholderiales bacterium]
MKIPLQITLRNIAKSDAVEAAIRRRAAKLDRYHRHIVSCRVVVEIPSRHKLQGKEFVVHLDIKVPGNEIVITHDHHEDLYAALQEAFHAAQRRLAAAAPPIARRYAGNRRKQLDQDTAPA